MTLVLALKSQAAAATAIYGSHPRLSYRWETLIRSVDAGFSKADVKSALKARSLPLVLFRGSSHVIYRVYASRDGRGTLDERGSMRDP